MTNQILILFCHQLGCQFRKNLKGILVHKSDTKSHVNEKITKR